MNKVLKGLVAVAATAAMAVAGFAGAASATAEETTATKYQITVPETDTHTYDAYQIFKGDLNDAGTVLSNITAGSDFKEKNAAGTNGADLTAAQAAEKIATGTYADDTAKLKAIQAFANLTTVYGSVSKDAPLFAEPGYYLFKDKDSTAGKNDAATLFIVKVVGNQEIERKANQPSVEKKVQDTNDSDGSTSDWQDFADYDVNDRVPFQLTATLPTDAADFAAYKTYKLVFHDSQSEGLTFNKDITVKYGDKVVSSDSYTVDTTGLNEGETFRVTINDVKTVKNTDGQPIAVTAGGKFTVAYSSTLNEKSIIGAQATRTRSRWNTPTIRTWVAKAKPVRLRKIPSSFSPTSWMSTRPSTLLSTIKICLSSLSTRRLALLATTPRKSLRSRLSRTLMASTSLPSRAWMTACTSSSRPRCRTASTRQTIPTLKSRLPMMRRLRARL